MHSKAIVNKEAFGVGCPELHIPNPDPLDAIGKLVFRKVIDDGYGTEMENRKLRNRILLAINAAHRPLTANQLINVLQIRPTPFDRNLLVLTMSELVTHGYLLRRHLVGTDSDVYVLTPKALAGLQAWGLLK